MLRRASPWRSRLSTGGKDGEGSRVAAMILRMSLPESMVRRRVLLTAAM
jgi:hypothetical protein